MLEKFLKDLSDLFKKYDIEINSHDVYDGEENYKGQDHYLIIDGEPYYQKTVEEIFHEITKA